jgi:RimJ/RimL family protein N-acetyltransferase
MIQTSLPDSHGYMSLGVSVDIVKVATEVARLVVAQVNPQMPRVHGECFIHLSDVDYAVYKDEPLLEFAYQVPDEVARQVGNNVARIIEDGDTLQVGYGSMPNAALAALAGKRHLGVHSELLTDQIVELMRAGVVDNTRKTLNRGKTVAAFCMGRKATYEFLHDNPTIEFRPVDYTNNPLTIARQRNMVAINSALEIDLTGQATAESLGKTFFSGMGGQADFMRGAPLSAGGKTILALESTASNGEISRIVPFLREGAGVTLTRGDVHYVATEYGIANLHGRNIRERAMELIAIAHPRFRPWLIEEAKKCNLIYRDQAYVPGVCGDYPRYLETYRTAKSGLNLFLRPAKLSDEPLLKDFFYSLSDQSMYQRFVSARKDMPHERLQEFVAIDYCNQMVILAVISEELKPDKMVGVGQYSADQATHMANVALVVADDYQGRGVGAEILTHLTQLAKRQGFLGFTAEVLAENKPMLHLFERLGLETESRSDGALYSLKMRFTRSTKT